MPFTRQSWNLVDVDSFANVTKNKLWSSSRHNASQAIESNQKSNTRPSSPTERRHSRKVEPVGSKVYSTNLPNLAPANQYLIDRAQHLL